MGRSASKPVSFRLPAADADRLTLAAAKAGVSPGELARDWVVERLAGQTVQPSPLPPPAPAGEVAAARAELARAVFVILTGLGPDLDEAAAADLVNRYFLGDGAREWMP